MTSFVGTYDLGSDGKTILVELMNAAENSNYVISDFVFSDPVTIDYTDPVSGLLTNSQIKLTYMSATGNYGVKTIYYNRIRASDFKSPNLHRGTAVKFSDLLGQINTRYGINILPTEISDFTLPVGDLITVPFQFLDSSIIYMGISTLSVGAAVPVVIFKDIFFSDGYGHTLKTSYTPSSDVFVIGLQIVGLQPNTQYEAQLFVTYTGFYGSKTIELTNNTNQYTDSAGSLYSFVPFGFIFTMSDAVVGTSGFFNVKIKSLPLPYSAYGQDVYTTSNLAINFISAEPAPVPTPAPVPAPAPSPYGTPTPPPASSSNLYLDTFTGTGTMTAHTSDSGNTYVDFNPSYPSVSLSLSNGLLVTSAGSGATNYSGGATTTLTLPGTFSMEAIVNIGTITANGYVYFDLDFGLAHVDIQADNTSIYPGLGSSTSTAGAFSVPYVPGIFTFRLDVTPTTREWFINNVSIRSSVTTESMAGTNFGFRLDTASSEAIFQLDSLRIYTGSTTPTPSPAPLPANAIIYAPFLTDLSDLTGRHILTSVGGAVVVNGSLSLSANQYVTAPQSPDFAFGTDNFSISFKSTKTQNGPNGYDTVLLSQPTDITGWYVELSSSRGFAFAYNDTTILSYNTGNFLDGIEHKWELTRVEGLMKLYKDGVSVFNVPDSTDITASGEFGISGNTVAPGYTFAGKVGDLVITRYSRTTPIPTPYGTPTPAPAPTPTPAPTAAPTPPPTTAPTNTPAPAHAVTPVKQFFTSSIFGILTEDKLTLNKPSPINGSLLSIPNPSDNFSIGRINVVAGTLRDIIISNSVNEPSTLQLFKPNIVSGNLRDVIISNNVNESSNLNLSKPTILTGTLQDIIVTYNSAEPSKLTLSKPTIVSGTLV